MERIVADSPEVIAIANLASVAASRIAAAFNDPGNFFEHMTLEELDRLRSAADRLNALQAQMNQRLDVYAETARALLAEVADAGR